MAATTARPSSGVRTNTDLGYTGTPRSRKARRRNVVRAEQLSQLDSGQVGDHHVARMGVHDRLYFGSGAEQLGVDVEFVRHRIPAVEFAVPVEVDDTDVVGDSEQEPAILGSSAPQQDSVVVQPDADMPEDVGGQSLMRQDPAGGGDDGAQLDQLRLRDGRDPRPHRRRRGLVDAEHQRLDGDRHRVRRVADPAEIDEVEVAQFDTVEDEQVVGHRQLVAQDGA